MKDRDGFALIGSRMEPLVLIGRQGDRVGLCVGSQFVEVTPGEARVVALALETTADDIDSESEGGA